MAKNTANLNVPGIPSPPQIWRTAIRVSEQGKRGKAGSGKLFLSPEEQMKSGRTFAEAKGGLHDDAASWEHRDINQSGYSKPYTERPGIMAHIADAKAGRFQHIIFAYTERSSRDLIDGILLYREFAEAGVSVHYLDIGLDETDDEFLFMRDLNLLLGNRSSRNLSRKISSNMRLRATGDTESNRPPLPHGLLPAWIHKVGQNQYEINEGFAPAVRRIIELRLERGWGYVKIATELNAEGLRTVGGELWAAARVQRQLSEGYIRRMLGEACYHANIKAKNKGLMTEELWIPGTYPALIDEDTANALRAVAKTRKPSPGVRGMSAPGDTEYLVAGMVWCAVCRRRLTPSSGGGDWAGSRVKSEKLRCYRCFLGATDTTKHTNSVGLSISAEQLEEAVKRVVLHAVAAPPAPLPKSTPKKTALKVLRDEKIIQAEIDNLSMMAATGRISLADFDRMAQPLRDEKAKLAAREEQAAVPLIREHALAAADLLSGKGDIPSAWRQLFLWTVTKVEAPFEVEGVRTRTKMPRRFARVTLRWDLADGGAVWYAPLFANRYTGEREIIAGALLREKDAGTNLLELTQHK